MIKKTNGKMMARWRAKTPKFPNALNSNIDITANENAYISIGSMGIRLNDRQIRLLLQASKPAISIPSADCIRT